VIVETGNWRAGSVYRWTGVAMGIDGGDSVGGGHVPVGPRGNDLNLGRSGRGHFDGHRERGHAAAGVGFHSILDHVERWGGKDRVDLSTAGAAPNHQV